MHRGLSVAKRKGRAARQQPIPTRANPIIPPAPILQPQMILGYDPTGPMEPVDIVSSKDGWSEFTLQDGSVIRAKVAVLDVKRAVGQFNVEGDPVYVLQMTMVNQVKAPLHLKKGYEPPKSED
jgi:hypothetical protein